MDVDILLIPLLALEGGIARFRNWQRSHGQRNCLFESSGFDVLHAAFVSALSIFLASMYATRKSHVGVDRYRGRYT
jgi:hypothetical protein